MAAPSTAYGSTVLPELSRPVAASRPTASPASPLMVARSLAADGHAVLPVCWPDAEGNCACSKHHTKAKDVGKAPLTNNGVLDATTDADQITAWWTDWPDANVGIAL